ncbi:putative lipoprotein [Escherichia coli]|uniref:Putative lipoprotein n=1 Tax=Escherichia coli TaxID=562 RepID=A0A2X3JPC4_ECOLX|nr:putative lipoprotein [Escherichia coli]
MQNQLINAPASVLAPSDVDIPLQLKGISVDQLGFVRIHDNSTCYAVKRISGDFVRPATSFPVILLLCLHHPD